MAMRGLSLLIAGAIVAVVVLSQQAAGRFEDPDPVTPCTLNECFNLTRCLSGGLSVYVYPLPKRGAALGCSRADVLSNERAHYQACWLHTLMSSGIPITDDANTACLMVPAIDLNCAFNTCGEEKLDELSTKLKGLTHWGEKGANHVIFNYNNDWPSPGIDAGPAAIWVRSSWVTTTYRRGFDVHLPLTRPRVRRPLREVVALGHKLSAAALLGNAPEAPLRRGGSGSSRQDAQQQQPPPPQQPQQPDGTGSMSATDMFKDTTTLGDVGAGYDVDADHDAGAVNNTIGAVDDTQRQAVNDIGDTAETAGDNDGGDGMVADAAATSDDGGSADDIATDGDAADASASSPYDGGDGIVAADAVVAADGTGMQAVGGHGSADDVGAGSTTTEEVDSGSADNAGYRRHRRSGRRALLGLWDLAVSAFRSVGGPSAAEEKAAAAAAAITADDGAGNVDPDEQDRRTSAAAAAAAAAAEAADSKGSSGSSSGSSTSSGASGASSVKAATRSATPPGGTTGRDLLLYFRGCLPAAPKGFCQHRNNIFAKLLPALQSQDSREGVVVHAMCCGDALSYEHLPHCDNCEENVRQDETHASCTADWPDVSYEDGMQRARYAFAPRDCGSLSYRVIEAIGMGAVPVLTGNGSFVPFDGEFALGRLWKECVVEVPEDEVASMVTRLRGISEQRYMQRRAACARLAAYGTHRTAVLVLQSVCTIGHRLEVVARQEGVGAEGLGVGRIMSPQLKALCSSVGADA